LIMKDKFIDIKFHEMGKYMGNKWQNTSSEEKQIYVVQAKQDKELYKREMADYRAEKEAKEDHDDNNELNDNSTTFTTTNNNNNTNNKNKNGNRKKKRDPNAPKINKHPYLYYIASIRSSVKIDNPSANCRDIDRIIASRYKTLSEEERKVYSVMAADDKVRYQREMDEYNSKKKKNEHSDDDDNDDSTEHVPPAKKKKKTNDTAWMSPPQQDSKKEEEEMVPNNRRLSRRQRALEVKTIDANQIATTVRPLNHNPPPSSKKSNNNGRTRSSDFVYDFGSDDDYEDYDNEDVDDHRDIDFKPPPQKQQKKKSYNKKRRRSSEGSSKDEKKYESTTHTSNSNEKAKDSGNNNSVLSPRIVGIVLDGNKCYVSYAPV